MDTSELDTLLQGGREMPTLDFKGRCAWDVKTFVKDVLAMANVLDGGQIVVGVEDGTLQRVGITVAERDTFKIDIMRDQVGPFADPHVDFHVEFVADADGLEYAVITVRPFDDVPVVCKRDGADVRQGAIYYRPQTGRVQSCEVRSSHDMRTILETAIARRLQKLRQIGIVSPLSPSGTTPTADDAFDRELGDL